MKDQIKRVIAEASRQSVSAGDIGAIHKLAAIGIDETLDLVLKLEPTVKDENGLTREVPDEVWPGWITVGDVYRFYGVK